MAKKTKPRRQFVDTTNETIPQYHIRMRPGDVGRYVLLPGDPGRVPLIASFLDDAQQIAENREHRTYTGMLDDVPVSVTSTGIGGPSTAIAVEELAKIGADTFIRVGTSGMIQDSVLPGHLIVVSAAVRDEGTALHYMPMAFPAVADLDVVACLRKACETTGATYHTGISHSKDSFYGEVEPDRMPLAGMLKERWQAWVQGGVLCSEMEAAALFVIARTIGKRAGGLMVAGGTHDGLEPLCRTAVEGVRLLIQLDQSTET
jgi:uridine phosphorylase|tara:strand:+ start:679 stop:1458 length:780 start_codon:yes stop_codon:yes gene_type:complete